MINTVFMGEKMSNATHVAIYKVGSDSMASLYWMCVWVYIYGKYLRSSILKTYLYTFLYLNITGRTIYIIILSIGSKSLHLMP